MDPINRIEIRQHRPDHTYRGQGGYKFDIYVEGRIEPIAISAAKGSPVGQCMRLLERLLMLSEKAGGYNAG